MAILYSLGSVLVERDELSEQRSTLASGSLDVRGFAKRSDLKVRFSTGEFVIPTTMPAVKFLRDDFGNEIAFSPIGENLPLTIAIREVYTGRFPKFPANDRSLLVASAVKGMGVYSEAPRAVNLIQQQVSRNQRMRTFSPTEKGTPYIFHTPALTQLSTSVGVELNFGGFPKEITDAIGNALQAASSIPVFAAASPYLLVGGVITKLAGNLAHAFSSSGSAEMTFSDEVNFIDPGSLLPHARFIVAVDSRERDFQRIKNDFKTDEQGRLVEKNNPAKSYEGEAPYVVMSLNGAPRPDLKDFAPTAATAAMLAKYYNIGEGRQSLATITIDAFKAYNDLTLIDDVKKLKEQLAAATAGSDEEKAIKAKLEALSKQMFNEELKKLLGL